MELFIIDAIGPFFQGQKGGVTNWSKVPFNHLEWGGGLVQERLERVVADFSSFTSTVSEMGFNAVSVDDVAHLFTHDQYPEGVKRKIERYQQLYWRLFQIAKKAGMRVFVTTDIMFFNRAIDELTKNSDKLIIELLREAFHYIFGRFPVDGIIVRLGECDGVDVRGDFISRLTIRTPKQLNGYLRNLLPVFNAFHKYLIVRTWTFGAFEIGDLIWNQRTYKRAFAGICNENLIVSTKYGDTDFFSRLDLSSLFYCGGHKKIIELQARREREGFGALPFYVGWDYEAYRKKLASSNTLMGIWVWSQTGGWSRSRDITFIRNSSLWNELNTCVTLRIFKDGLTAEQALLSFFRNKDFIPFMRKGTEMFRRLLYVEGFAIKNYYFRRLRVLPLIWVCWDHVTINPLLIAFHECVGVDVPQIQADELDDFFELGRRLGVDQLDFYMDTIRILHLCRRALARKLDLPRLKEEVQRYEEQYPDFLKFSASDSCDRRGEIRVLFKWLVRERPEYRLVDRVLMCRTVSRIILTRFTSKREALPSFIDKQAMNFDVVLH